MNTEQTRHETRDVQPRRVLLTAVVIGGALLLVLLAAYGLMQGLGTRQTSAALSTEKAAPVPHLQPHPQQDLQMEHDEKRGRLNSYGWVDRSAGIARIPIARAMELLALQRRNPNEDKQ